MGFGNGRIGRRPTIRGKEEAIIFRLQAEGDPDKLRSGSVVGEGGNVGDTVGVTVGKAVAAAGCWTTGAGTGVVEGEAVDVGAGVDSAMVAAGSVFTGDGVTSATDHR